MACIHFPPGPWAAPLRYDRSTQIDKAVCLAACGMWPGAGNPVKRFLARPAREPHAHEALLALFAAEVHSAWRTEQIRRLHA